MYNANVYYLKKRVDLGVVCTSFGRGQYFASRFSYCYSYIVHVLSRAQYHQDRSVPPCDPAPRRKVWSLSPVKICEQLGILPSTAALSKCAGCWLFVTYRSIGLYWEPSSRQGDLAFAAYYSCYVAHCYKTLTGLLQSVFC